jgi:hypothetical protein
LSDQWEFFPCAIEEDRAFIFVDVGIEKSIADAPSTLVKVVLAYKQPREDGMPTQAEYDAVLAIEKRLEAFVEAAKDWYVGRITVAGTRDFRVYTTQSEVQWRKFARTLTTETGYDMTVEVTDDPQHRSYIEGLYPTPDDWQVINDMHVLEQLAKEGDDAGTSRRVDHWAYFISNASVEPFIEWAEANGLSHDKSNSHETEDGRYCVRLSHNCAMTLDVITHFTIGLRHRAEVCGGEYDGWETQVVSGDGVEKVH